MCSLAESPPVTIPFRGEKNNRRTRRKAGRDGRPACHGVPALWSGQSWSQYGTAALRLAPHSDSTRPVESGPVSVPALRSGIEGWSWSMTEGCLLPQARTRLGRRCGPRDARRCWCSSTPSRATTRACASSAASSSSSTRRRCSTSSPRDPASGRCGCGFEPRRRSAMQR